MKIYQHRQRANVLSIILGVGAAICFILAAQLPGAFISLVVGVILLICLVLFSSLSVEVAEEYLSWHFGLGLIRKQVLLADIEKVEVTRTSFIEGWGIHLTLRGWLYNVSGFQAVAITLKNGKRFLLGTDEPERLASILQSQRV